MHDETAQVEEFPFESTRISAFREALWRPLMWAVDGVLLLLAYGDLASKVAPSTEEWIKKLAFLSSLPWYSKIIILLGANIFLIGEGTFRALRKREGVVRGLRDRLDAINNTRPAIKPREPGAIYTELVNHNFTDESGAGITSTVPFLKVRFINDPAIPALSANAPDIRAKITYYRSTDNICLFTIDGRWAESTQPTALHPLVSRSGLLGATFAIGEERSVDIAYRDGQTGQYFAWNNDNYNYPHFLHPEHRLLGDQFRVDIRLRGGLVDSTFTVTFRTTDDGFEFSPTLTQQICAL